MLREPTPHSGLDYAQRQARINELRRELASLLAEEAAECGKNLDAVNALCLEHLRNGRPVDAIKAFREGSGCSLGEARDAVNGLAAQNGLKGYR